MKNNPLNTPALTNEQTGMGVPELSRLFEQGWLRGIDLAFADLLYQQEQVTECKLFSACVVALLSVKLSEQHTCLTLTEIQRILLQDWQLTELSFDSYWNTASCVSHYAIGDPVPQQPLVLMGEYVYLQRYWCYEHRLAQQIVTLTNRDKEVDEVQVNALLEQLFAAPQKDQKPDLNFVSDQKATMPLDWQKVAVALAARNQFAVITGGPGTGKTTTVTRLMALLQGQRRQANQKPLHIALCAPTGKAAARLSESISSAKDKLPKSLQADLPDSCSTIHRLLGSIPNSPYFRANANQPLHLDVLIVDEASMVDLPLMAKLFEAIPQHASVILLGDQDQLASVEVGSVLSDICACADSAWQSEYALPFSTDMQTYLAKLTEPNARTSIQSDEGTSELAPLRDQVVKLWHSHRFSSDSGIGQLAGAINRGDVSLTRRLLNEASWRDIQWRQDYSIGRLVQDLIPHYAEYFDLLHRAGAQQAHKHLQKLQVLCAFRQGEWGVKAMNAAIEQELVKQGYIPHNMGHYFGRPIMLSENDHQLGLYNGDIGIVYADPQQPNLLKVSFLQGHDSIRTVLIHQLPAHETVYAMTIHKSQGSEFDTVHLCLPDSASAQALRSLSKELIYTGLTRAKHAFFLYGQSNLLSRCLATRVSRGSGLKAHILNLLSQANNKVH